MRPAQSVLAGLSEVFWYALIRRMRRWAVEMTEEEMARRSVALGDRVAWALGRRREAATAMLRGLAHTVYFRTRGISILDRLTPAGRRSRLGFLEEMRGVKRAFFVTAHMGPFQLQMDLLAAVEHRITFIYRSYRWTRLQAEIDLLRLQTERFTYVDMHETRMLAAQMASGQSIGVLGDVTKRGPRALPLFGEATLDDWPVRQAVRQASPIFVGGLYTESADRGGAQRFGVFYTRVDPTDAAQMGRAYSAAMEGYIMKNRQDWIRGS